MNEDDYVKAISILKQLVLKMDDIPLDMANYFMTDCEVLEENMDTDFSNPAVYSMYLKEIGKNNECDTSCCLAGFIPIVDIEWAKRFDYVFNRMAYNLCKAIAINSLNSNLLWRWLFSSDWGNDKELAKYRLNMIINEKKYYNIDFGNFIELKCIAQLEEHIFKLKPMYTKKSINLNNKRK